MVPLLICVNVGDKREISIRLVRSPNITCWEGQHKIFLNTVALPLIAFFGLFIPLYVGYKIYSSREVHSLVDRKKYLLGFEKFIMPYRESRNLYGILLIFNKIALVILKELVIQMSILGDTIIILVIIFFYLIVYFVVLKISEPYKREKFEILDKMEKRLIIIHLSNALTAIIWVSNMEDRDKIVGWLILTYAFLTNFVFLTWWSHCYFGFFKNRLLRVKTLLFSKIESSFMKKSFIFKKQSINKKKRVKDKNIEMMLEELNHLKILNRLLITRIKELELELVKNDSIPSEGPLEKPFLNLIEPKLISKTKTNNGVISDGSANSLLFNRYIKNLDNDSDQTIKFNSLRKNDSFIIKEKFDRSKMPKIIEKIEKKLLSFSLVGKTLIGKNFHKNFLIVKYRNLLENFKILKSQHIVGKQTNKSN